MHPTTTRRLDVALAMVLLAAAVWTTGVLTIVWAADFDGSDESTSVAAVSALVLGAGTVLALLVGAARRRWRLVSLLLLGSAVLAALPWLVLLG